MVHWAIKLWNQVVHGWITQMIRFVFPCLFSILHFSSSKIRIMSFVVCPIQNYWIVALPFKIQDSYQSNVDSALDANMNSILSDVTTWWCGCTVLFLVTHNTCLYTSTMKYSNISGESFFCLYLFRITNKSFFFLSSTYLLVMPKWSYWSR